MRTVKSSYLAFLVFLTAATLSFAIRGVQAGSHFDWINSSLLLSAIIGLFIYGSRTRRTARWFRRLADRHFEATWRPPAPQPSHCRVVPATNHMPTSSHPKKEAIDLERFRLELDQRLGTLEPA